MGIWRSFGISVRGPAHAQPGLPNQDAWIGRHTRRAHLIVVCDGLGSRRHADVGARHACAAVAAAIGHFSATPLAPPDLLLRLIHALWNLRVHPLGTQHCATTCLLGAALADGRLVMAQLGDGLALLRRAQGDHVALQPEAERFGNQTTGLGLATSLAEWRVHVEASAGEGTALLLASDGISEDLAAGQAGPFLEHLLRAYGPLSPRQRGGRLQRALQTWPTPRHGDDKTLALLIQEASGR